MCMYVCYTVYNVYIRRIWITLWKLLFAMLILHYFMTGLFLFYTTAPVVHIQVIASGSMHVPIIHVFLKVKVDCLSCDPKGLHHELRSYWIFSVFWIWHPKNRSHTKQKSRSNQPLHSAVHHSICYRVWRFNLLANDLHVDTRKLLNIVKMTVVIVPAFCHWLTWWLSDS